VTDPAAPSGQPAKTTPQPTTPFDSVARFTWGAVVAIVALVVLGGVFVILVTSGAKSSTIATAFASLSTPIVAIASAYFGIQIAGKAANTAGNSAADASKAADSARIAAHTAAGVATEASRRVEEAVAGNHALLRTMGYAPDGTRLAPEAPAARRTATSKASQK
jgi:hypothetical protein